MAITRQSVHPDGELDVEQVGMADVADDLQAALLAARRRWCRAG